MLTYKLTAKAGYLWSQRNWRSYATNRTWPRQEQVPRAMYTSFTLTLTDRVGYKSPKGLAVYNRPAILEDIEIHLPSHQNCLRFPKICPTYHLIYYL